MLRIQVVLRIVYQNSKSNLLLVLLLLTKKIFKVIPLKCIRV
uniref:Uncharacterized protein n=1 Tax=Siphoviridae sp. ctLqe90 TaxID=2825456 RepID=A0A8S5Q369_9CAUD|nr:MAG TPA: hypothetical protein [Siphoviridae sp. ctLqe90]